MISHSTIEITRPADTTAYAVGDVVSASSSAGAANRAYIRGGGILRAAVVQTDQATNVAEYRLHFYSANPSTVPADNAANTQLYANAGIYLGNLTFAAVAGSAGTNTGVAAQLVDQHFPIVGDVYVVLETRTIFTPDSEQKFHIQLFVEQ